MIDVESVVADDDNPYAPQRVGIRVALRVVHGNRRRQRSLSDLGNQAQSSLEAAPGKAEDEESAEVRSAVEELLRLKDELAANDRILDALLAELSH